MQAGIADPDPGDRQNRVCIDGTKLEIIETLALPSDVSDIEALDRLFVLGHRWALESAERLRVVVVASDVDAEFPVAIPTALVATKLHAFCDRQQGSKRAADAYGIYRLLETRDRNGDVARTTNEGPRGLAEVVHEVIAKHFIDGATRVVRYLKAYGDPDWPPIDGDDLRRTVRSFASHLRS